MNNQKSVESRTISGLVRVLGLVIAFKAWGRFHSESYQFFMNYLFSHEDIAILTMSISVTLIFVSINTSRTNPQLSSALYNPALAIAYFSSIPFVQDATLLAANDIGALMGSLFTFSFCIIKMALKKGYAKRLIADAVALALIAIAVPAFANLQSTLSGTELLTFIQFKATFLLIAGITTSYSLGCNGRQRLSAQDN